MFLERDTVSEERHVRVDGRHHAPGRPIDPPQTLRYASCKSLTEMGLTLLLLLPALPVILAAAVLVKLTSRGPIFYSQRRVGRHGRTYTLYKVRTMFHDCERFTGPQWATIQDPRITPIGRWLRRVHVDELPQ